MMEVKVEGSRQSLARIFAVPSVLAVLSAFGLVSALMGDGVWDGLSWLTLAMPIATATYHIARERSGRKQLR